MKQKILIEPCPFCQSKFCELHEVHENYATVCAECCARGPVSATREFAALVWNAASLRSAVSSLTTRIYNATDVRPPAPDRFELESFEAQIAKKEKKQTLEEDDE